MCGCCRRLGLLVGAQRLEARGLDLFGSARARRSGRCACHSSRRGGGACWCKRRLGAGPGPVSRCRGGCAGICRDLGSQGLELCLDLATIIRFGAEAEVFFVKMDSGCISAGSFVGVGSVVGKARVGNDAIGGDELRRCIAKTALSVCSLGRRVVFLGFCGCLGFASVGGGFGWSRRSGSRSGAGCGPSLVAVRRSRCCGWLDHDDAQRQFHGSWKQERAFSIHGTSP